MAGLPAARPGRRRHRHHRQPVGRASTNPDYGIRGGAPYGGACLPKDTKGFLGLAELAGVPMPLLSAVVEVNEAMERLVARELSEAGDPVVELEPREGLTRDARAS